jgi:hypothetical protein
LLSGEFDEPIRATPGKGTKVMPFYDPAWVVSKNQRGNASAPRLEQDIRHAFIVRGIDGRDGTCHQGVDFVVRSRRKKLEVRKCARLSPHSINHLLVAR